MRLRSLLTSTLLLTLTGGLAVAQQPYAGCWFPDDIRNWTPSYDKDAKFNRSRVPLKQRVATPEVMKANAEQFAEGQLMTATVTSKMCGLCAAQGYDDFIGYTPTFWQYIEKFVNWGGADDEGIIVIPPAPTIDAAHINGTKAFANIFLQGTNNGGMWAKQLVSRNGNEFPYAKKLYEMAKYYGYDGYFINDESNQELQSTWVEWVEYFYSLAQADGDNTMEIVWYDASTKPYVDMLKTNPRSSHFLDYGAVEDWRSYASRIGCTQEEIFHRIYSGIECGRAGLMGFARDLDNGFTRTGHVTSLALFVPEDKIWKSNVESYFYKPDARGEKAYEAMRKTYENERGTYVNKAGDPSTIVKKGSSWSPSWRGLSGAMVEATAIDAFPFTTNFNVGVGKHRFVEGVNAGSRDWSHGGMQGILPTWRWWIENGDGLTESIDWDDAYSGGNSMLIAGTLPAGSNLMRLYKMAAKCDGGELRLVYKSNNTLTPVLRLSTSSSVNPDLEIAARSTSQSNGWTVAVYDLSSAKGKTVYMVGFDLKADPEIAAYEMRLGQLSIIPEGYSPKAVEISNLAILNKLGEDGGDLRVTWDWADNADLDHFDIYVADAAGKQTLVGQTRDEAYYIPEIKRNADEASVEIKVVPVMKNSSTGKTASVKAGFAGQSAPVVEIITSCSYAKVGDVIELHAVAAGNTTECLWTLPEGLRFAEGADASKPDTRVVVESTGSFKVKAKLTNTLGSGEAEAFVVEGMTEDRFNQIANIALGKKIVDQSTPANSAQGGANLLDGVRKPENTDAKWCTSCKYPYVVIDLMDPFIIYGFGIFDCKSGDEDRDNIANYRIELSNDGETWTEAVDRNGRAGDNIKYDYIEPTAARFVRLAPNNFNAIITPRIWEFEVYGRQATQISFTLPNDVLVKMGEKSVINIPYSLNGETRADNFELKASASNANVEITNISEDAASSSFNVEIAAKGVGVTALTFDLTNGEYSKTRSMSAIVDDPNAKNILSGLAATVYQYPYGPGWDDYYDTYTVSGLTDGDTKSNALEAIEEASGYEDDIDIIFELAEECTPTKIRLYFPDDNYALNENDQMSEVVKDVTVKYKDNGKFVAIPGAVITNIGKKASVEHIFGSDVKTSHVSITLNNNIYAYPALAEVEIFAAGGTSAIKGVELKQHKYIEAVYNLQGVRIENPGNGIHIVRYSDGTTEKVLFR